LGSLSPTELLSQMVTLNLGFTGFEHKKKGCEPMIMSILGILIGGLMIAMYLPIFMLGSVM
ncbi:MAG: hypothetical protein ACPH55_05945, partial [Luminiphilus sp.]